MPGGGVPAVRPHPQPLAGGREQRRAEGPSVPVPAVPGVHDQLGGRRLHQVRVLQLGITDKFPAGGEQQMGHALPLPAAQLQPALFGHRLLPVGPGRLVEQSEHGLGLLRGERGKGLDRAGVSGPYGVVAGHAYEGTGRHRQIGGKEATQP